MSASRVLVAAGFVAVLLAVGAARAAPEPPAAGDSWKQDWEIEEGFSIALDSHGFRFPVNVAFVPKPGPGPKDPLYFVLELRGTVKVVTNDRTVATFAENITNFRPVEELPSPKGESGSAGICLAPEHGFVFVTYAYTSKGGVLRNALVRLEAPKRTFALKPVAQKIISAPFEGDVSAISHQIGPCQVHGDHLFVSVGDGERPQAARQMTSTLGKILRMTLDGAPVADNPFRQDDVATQPMNFVWAYGFRNPFGLRVLNGRVYVADNGPKVDRFVEVQAGEGYFYDGTDWGLATRADYLFVPAVSPVTIDFLGAGATFFPDSHANRFFVALSGSPPDPPGPGQNGQKSIVSFGYDFDKRRLTSVPSPFVRYRGEGQQLLVGLAFGSDGLYFVPLLPSAGNVSAVFRVKYAPEAKHPYGLSDLSKYRARPDLLMNHKGCFSCHPVDEGHAGVAPALDGPALVKRIAARLDSPTYLESLKGLGKFEAELGRSFGTQRNEVLAADGLARVRLWVKNHLLEPLFDNAYAQMPNMGLSEEEAVIITDYLVQDEPLKARIWGVVESLIGTPRHRHWMIALGLGFGSAWLGTLGWVRLRGRRKGRRPTS